MTGGTNRSDRRIGRRAGTRPKVETKEKFRQWSTTKNCTGNSMLMQPKSFNYRIVSDKSDSPHVLSVVIDSSTSQMKSIATIWGFTFVPWTIQNNIPPYHIFYNNLTQSSYNDFIKKWIHFNWPLSVNFYSNVSCYSGAYVLEG